MQLHRAGGPEDPRLKLNLKCCVYNAGTQSLTIKQSIIDQWRESADKSGIFEKILADHNSEFNPNGVTEDAIAKRQRDSEGVDDEGPSSKKARPTLPGDSKTSFYKVHETFGVPGPPRPQLEVPGPLRTFLF
jgi:hypothetical protein